MDIINLLRECRETDDYKAFIDSIPYAKTIGIDYSRHGDETVYRLPAKQNNIGNPTLPAIHGGVLGGFIEHAIILHVLMELDNLCYPKIIDLSIDYLSAAHFKDCYAECLVLRRGKRVVNVSAKVWQTRKTQPVATARAHLLLKG